MLLLLPVVGGRDLGLELGVCSVSSLTESNFGVLECSQHLLRMVAIGYQHLRWPNKLLFPVISIVLFLLFCLYSLL